MQTEEQRLLEELYIRDKRIVSISETDLKTSEDVKINGQKIPDPKLHQRISFLKSGIRILACMLGGLGFFEIGFLALGVAEIVGIVEELV